MRKAESNQVLVAEIKADKIYTEVHNGKVEARNVQANDVNFLGSYQKALGQVLALV